jgi:putative transposase
VIERKRFVRAAAEQRISFAELCRLFSISRKNGYKWLERASDGESLEDRSRKPRSNSRAIAPDVERRLVRLRKAHRTWGARKLLAWLDENEPGWELPAASTVTEALKRNGLVEPRRHRQRLPPRSAPLAHATRPNDVWCIDFKGDFLVGDGRRCYPLTVTDAHSRMLLCCRSHRGTGHDNVVRSLEATFRTWGLPTRMRSDNGVPFGTMRTGPLSRLSAWLVKLGVLPEYIDVASPHQNGRHERFHWTLKRETAMPPASSLYSQQRRFDVFRREYNNERPHEALGQKTPASVHRAASRPFPTTIRDPEYPASYEVRKLAPGGAFSWHDTMVFFSEALEGQVVGLTEVDNGRWEIYFGPLLIGQLHEALPGLGVVRRRPYKVSPMSPV